MEVRKEKQLEKVNQEIEENFQKKILKRLHDGDVFVVMKVFEDLTKGSDISVTPELLDHIGKSIEKFNRETFIPIEYAESLLSSLGSLLESPQFVAKIDSLVSNKFLIPSLIEIVNTFEQKLVHRESAQSSYSSHYCYELALYIILEFVEKPQMLALLLENESIIFRDLFTSLGEIIPVDIMLLTQVSIISF
jgi:hypothetical protein